MSLALTAIPNRDIRQLLINFLPELELEYGGKHLKARHPVTRDYVTIPGTPSDYRSCKNLRSQLQKLIATGKGFIASKKGDRN